MTKTEELFQDAIKISAEVVKDINEDDYDLDDKEIIDLNGEVSDIQCELLELPMDFEVKNRKEYCKKLLGKDYFSDNRCWEYLSDIVYEIENDIGSMIMESIKERSSENEIIVSELQDTVEYYCGLYEEDGELKGRALESLKNAVERLEVFNAIGSIYQWGVETLNKCGIKYKGLKESKSIKEGKNAKKSLEIIRRKLIELINDDTIQEEFNAIWEDDGIYDSVDDMFEVSVHNVLNDILKEHTITILPF